jgi:hypothetical protein
LELFDKVAKQKNVRKNPKLPKFLDRKIYKTGQTRGADDDVIYQNRVSRDSTVLIPYSHINLADKAPNKERTFQNGFIVLIKPEEYFENENISEELEVKKVFLGQNALLFYETREQWNKYSPEKKGFEVANSRNSPLGGFYVARVPSNTSEGSEKILRGYTETKLKGAGIRVYEYADPLTIRDCRIQLELLFWNCYNSQTVARFAGMSEDEVKDRISFKVASSILLSGIYSY